MARTASFRSFVRLMRAALLAERRSCSAMESVEILQEQTLARTTPAISRRRFLLSTGATLALGTITGFPLRIADAKPLSSSLSVGIVGAGLAGLACADTLKTRGIRASVYEATARSGGRCWSLRGFFPGQVAERGGELIDTLHKTILGYAKRFRLALEDDHDQPGEIVYHFFGQRHSEAVIVAEFRDFVSVMRTDLNRLSREVTATSHTPDDVALDRTNLLAYREGHNRAVVSAGPLAKAAIVSAYEAEYGLAAAEQSCLNFLLFIHADRRSQFTPFGVFSDEKGLDQQKLAVNSGYWPLFRYNPALTAQGQNPLVVDSKAPTIRVEEYAYNETRYRMLLQSDETRAEALMKLAREDAKGRWQLYQQMAAMHYGPNGGDEKKN